MGFSASVPYQGLFPRLCILHRFSMALLRYLGIDIVASLGDAIEYCSALNLRQNPRSAMTALTLENPNDRDWPLV